MPHIGGIYCDSVQGVIPRPIKKKDTWEVPGVHGTGVADLGWRQPVQNVRVVIYESVVNVHRWYAWFDMIQGQRLAYVNDLGDFHDNCEILEMGSLQISPAVRPGTRIMLKGVIEMKVMFFYPMNNS